MMQIGREIKTKQNRPINNSFNDTIEKWLIGNGNFCKYQNKNLENVLYILILIKGEECKVFEQLALYKR